MKSRTLRADQNCISHAFPVLRTTNCLLFTTGFIALHKTRFPKSTLNNTARWYCTASSNSEMSSKYFLCFHNELTFEKHIHNKHAMHLDHYSIRTNDSLHPACIAVPPPLKPVQRKQPMKSRNKATEKQGGKVGKKKERNEKGKGGKCQEQHNAP